ncbi:response regulator [Candidatus Contubernalis alkaliaceticus]|uniref:hypothetical protein n=1 Tax=Candidatus Contubernalis alkaliaceticus TaxID=338645 RepID=UPI001F4BEF9E|nr:hypothetical protein [Candidatus Contubernalis alkalaceticus]UNC92190.1 hypothetical protein HUE98_08860 [Candidatus Contubernalis alkalaceticus]
MLSQLGYKAHYAVDGAEAIIKNLEAKKTDHPFDLVVIDLTILGGMGGKDTIKYCLMKIHKLKLLFPAAIQPNP